MLHPSPDAIISQLPDAALRSICARYLYPVSDGDRRIEALRRTVTEGYEIGLVPADAIREAVS